MSNAIIRGLNLAVRFDDDRFWTIILRIVAFGILLAALTGKQKILRPKISMLFGIFGLLKWVENLLTNIWRNKQMCNILYHRYYYNVQPQYNKMMSR